ncbi:MAG: sigma-70 family RNA polymerase sigma factor [Gluconacetobacter liquefaciens]
MRRSLRRFVEGRLRDSADSEDLVQETYLRLHVYRRTRSVADVKAFCFEVARNLIHDYRRRRQGDPVVDILPEDVACPQPRADEIMTHKQRVDSMVAAMCDMSSLRREIFIRQKLDGHSTQEIAEQMGLSRACVEKHVTRAIATLRDALHRKGFDTGNVG